MFIFPSDMGSMSNGKNAFSLLASDGKESVIKIIILVLGNYMFIAVLVAFSTFNWKHINFGPEK